VIPSAVTVLLVCILELGTIPENTLIRCVIDVIDPSGNKVLTDNFDASATRNVVSRYVAMRRLSFEVTEAGVWKFNIWSGGNALGTYNIEIGRKQDSF